MNIAKIYQDATTVVEPSKDTPEQVAEAGRKQDDAIAHHKWLSADRTIEFFELLELRKQGYITLALSLTSAIPHQKDPTKIIQLLTQVNEIQSIIDTYGRH